MPVKKQNGSAWVDPDDAPILTDAFFEKAEIFKGDKFVGRGRGRPKSDNPKEAVNLRLDKDVVENLRFGGPGWQTRVNDILRAYLRLDVPQ